MSGFQLVLDQEIVDFDQKLAQVVESLIRKAKHTLCVAESFTGGLLSQFFSVLIPDRFKGGVTVFHPMNCITLCGVLPKTIRHHGLASEEVGEEMARGAMRHFHATLSISVSPFVADDRLNDPKKGLSGSVFISFLLGDTVEKQSIKLSGPRELGQKMVLQSVLMFLKQRLVT